MTSILHDYNFCPLCIIYPILGLPKIDILRDMAASNVFEMVFSHSIYSVYRRKTLMSVKLVHIKRVYELLSSQPRAQTQVSRTAGVFFTS